MTAQMGDLPDALDAGGGQLGGERAAEEGAAAVALAVGADERERIAGVGPPAERGVEGAVVAPAERGEVEVEQRLRVARSWRCAATRLPGTVWAAYTRRAAACRSPRGARGGG